MDGVVNKLVRLIHRGDYDKDGEPVWEPYVVPERGKGYRHSAGGNVKQQWASKRANFVGFGRTIRAAERARRQLEAAPA